MDDGSPDKGVTDLAEEGLSDAGQTLADNVSTPADPCSSSVWFPRLRPKSCAPPVAS